MIEIIDKLRQPVTEVMTRNIKFVTPDTLMTDVSEIFKSSHFHHLPVLDNNGVVVGMISKLDFHTLLSNYTVFQRDDVERQNKKFLATLIAEEIMTKDPVCIHYEATVLSAAHVFQENLFRALPVVDDKVCIGIVTPFDILKYLINDPELIES